MSIANALKLAGGVVALAGTFYFARKQLVGKKAAVAREKQEMVAEVQDDLNKLVKWISDRDLPLTTEEQALFDSIRELTFESELVSILSAVSILKNTTARIEEANSILVEMKANEELVKYQALVTDGLIVETPELVEWITQIRKRLSEHDSRIESDATALAQFNLMAAAKPAK